MSGAHSSLGDVGGVVVIQAGLLANTRPAAVQLKRSVE
jgi:hypothetical protein